METKFRVGQKVLMCFDSPKEFVITSVTIKRVQVNITEAGEEVVYSFDVVYDDYKGSLNSNSPHVKLFADKEEIRKEYFQIFDQDCQQAMDAIQADCAKKKEEMISKLEKVSEDV